MTRLRNWNVHLVRRDGLESHSLDLTRRRFVLGLLAVAASLIGVGLVSGLYWASRQESATITQLEDEIAGLRESQAQVQLLARRLAEVEEDYGLLREVVTDGRPDAPAPTSVPVGRPGNLTSRPDDESDTLAWPLAQRGFVTRMYGSRADASPVGHPGLDIAVPTGSYVRAIQAGRVEEVGEDSVYGKFVRIAHADGLTSLYGHNAWLFASTGDEVDRLQVIALSGNTGRSTAPHLHLELAQNGSLIDPLTLVSEAVGRGAGADPEPN